MRLFRALSSLARISQGGLDHNTTVSWPRGATPHHARRRSLRQTAPPLRARGIELLPPEHDTAESTVPKVRAAGFPFFFRPASEMIPFAGETAPLSE